MKILKFRFTEIKFLFILFFSLPLALSAQLNDHGTYMRTDDQLTIGVNSDAYPFYVKKDNSDWQALFRNRYGYGADVFIAHGAGYGMRIKGYTTDAKFTLKLQNLNDDTNVFHNNGKVGLGLKGNVGIGTTSAIHKLHVQVTGRDGIRLEGNNTGDAIFQIDNGGGTHYIFDKANVNTLNIESANDLVFNTNGPSEKMRIRENGKIGIGTSNPLKTLHVEGESFINGNLYLTNPNQNNGNGGKLILASGLDNGAIHSISVKNYWTEFRSHPNEGWKFITSTPSNPDDVKMRIHGGSGKVMIGSITSTPGNYRLYVENGILTEKVKVAVKSTGDWSDYVFEEDYDLMPIEELKGYVAENKHLPNVPSAEEVVNEGIDMAQMDAKLLEKIEEVHLYIFELKKEVEELKTQIDDKQ